MNRKTVEEIKEQLRAPDALVKRTKYLAAAQRERTGGRTDARVRHIGRRVALAGMCAALAMVLAMPYLTHSNDGRPITNGSGQVVQGSENPDGFAGFELTVLAAPASAGTDGKVQTNEARLSKLGPTVEIPLADYSQLMSSVPGLPITIELMDETQADEIRVRAESGSLMTWDIESGTIDQAGGEYVVHEVWTNDPKLAAGSETVYWGPGDAEEAVIVVTAYQDEKEVGSQKIRIHKENGKYYGSLV